MLMQPTTSALDSAVKQHQISCLVQLPQDFPRGSEILTIKSFKLATVSVICEQQVVRACSGKFVGHQDVGRGLVGNGDQLESGDANVAAGTAACAGGDRRRVGRYWS